MKQRVQNLQLHNIINIPNRSKMINIILRENNLIISLVNRKRLDSLIIYELQNSINKHINNDFTILTLDLSGIEFIDSVSFSMLIEINNALQKLNKQFYISNVSSDVGELIKLLKLENVLKIFPYKTTQPCSRTIYEY